MLLRNLNDVRELFDSVNGTLVGVGMTAFPRIIPAYFIRPYCIVALRKTRDLNLIKKMGRLFCLEEETGGPIGKTGYTSAHLLAHSSVQKFLRTLPYPKHLLLYQNYPELESLAKNEGWVLLANRASLRMRVGVRTFFKKLLSDLHLPMIPGAIYPIEVIHAREYKDWNETVGPRFVVQLPEISQGGGKGTFFIYSRADYQMLRERLKQNTWRGVNLKSVSIHLHVDGIPVSMALCLTRHGVLFSGVQRQLIDLPYCKDLTEDGVFCGHVWEKPPWPSTTTEQVRTQAQVIGDYLAALGYKGIVGIDFLINKSYERVFPVEINPRLTGVFPMLSLLHIERRVVPLEAFHILEFLNVPYEVNIDELNALYAEPVTGSHVLIFLLSGGKDGAIKALGAGLYQFDSCEEKISFVRGAIDYGDIENDKQFIIIDGPPAMGGEVVQISDPHYRLCRLLFSYPVADDNGVLSSRGLKAVEWVYRKIIRGTA
jgi:hypothetical protein